MITPQEHNWFLWTLDYFWHKVKERKVAELITPSIQKHRIVHAYTNNVSFNCQNIRGNGVTVVNVNTMLVDNVSQNLRLAFSTIDGSCIKRRKTNPYVRGTVFSHVFYISKDATNGNSTTFTVDQGELLVRNSQATNKRDDNGDSFEEHKRNVIDIPPTSGNLQKETLTRFSIDMVGVVRGSMDNSGNFPDGELVGSQTAFDETWNDIEWPLVDQNASNDHMHGLESV
jgi:hypothetical protein